MIFNLMVGVIGGIAIVVAVVIDKELAPADHVTLIATLSTGTVLALVAELFLPAKLKPRVWWVFPLWMLGLGVLGGVVIEHVNPWAGGALIAIAVLAFAIRTWRQIHEPGGKWVAWMTGAAIAIGLDLTLEELAGVTGVWWGMVIRGPLILAFLYATVRLLLARHAAKQADVKAAA